ncbi:MAG TPA: heme-binding protein [Candidatus Acidoferrales bacterium]|nr:heme-binding protein [Candidatus Acidoferrales bacterium]
MPNRLLIESAFTLLCALCAAISANAQALLPYGPSINLEKAKKVVAPAAAEARKNGWNLAFAVVDTGGNLVYFEKMDDTQIGSINVAIEKARSAALFKRPTKVFEDALKGGATPVLRVEGAVPVEGGIPIVIDGKIVGAIGASGATSAQDGECAKAGADALK